MMRAASFGLRSVLVGTAVLVLGTLTGCGGDSTAGTSSTANGTAGTIERTSPTITGVPVTTAVVGQPYSFQPQAANTSGTVTFSVTNLPSWAKFNTTTGQLSGTPDTSKVGQYPGITINLVAGADVVTLPAFTITVAAATANPDTVTLSWEAPTANSDGSQLVDLKGYKVHYGPSSKTYSDVIQVANAGLTTYVVQNLPAGKYYFAVTAYNGAGQESSYSEEVSTQVD